VSAQHGEILFGNHHPRCHLRAGRSLAIRAVTVRGQGWLGIEPVRHLAAGTLTRVLLAHVIPPFAGGSPPPPRGCWPNANRGQDGQTRLRGGICNTSATPPTSD